MATVERNPKGGLTGTWKVALVLALIVVINWVWPKYFRLMLEDFPDDVSTVEKKVIDTVKFNLSMQADADSLTEGAYLAIYLDKKTLEWASGKGRTQEEAKQFASENCGRSCVLAGWSRSACAALALRKDQGLCWGSFWGDSMEEANIQALQLCQKHGCDCTVVYSDCYR